MCGIDLIYSHFNLHATCIFNAVADRVYLSACLFIKGTRDEYNLTFRISDCYFWCTSNIITEITDQMTSVDLHHFLTTTRSQVESKVIGCPQQSGIKKCGYYVHPPSSRLLLANNFHFEVGFIIQPVKQDLGKIRPRFQQCFHKIRF